MKLKVLSCNATRPDKRAIAQCMAEVSSNMDGSLASELTDILLEGDTVEIEVEDKNTATALRALRKLGLDYEIIG